MHPDFEEYLQSTCDHIMKFPCMGREIKDWLNQNEIACDDITDFILKEMKAKLYRYRHRKDKENGA